MVIGLVECPSCHTRVIPMSPDNRCPSCQELIPSPETDVISNHSPVTGRYRRVPSHVTTGDAQRRLEPENLTHRGPSAQARSRPVVGIMLMLLGGVLISGFVLEASATILAKRIPEGGLLDFSRNFFLALAVAFIWWGAKQLNAWPRTLGIVLSILGILGPILGYDEGVPRKPLAVQIRLVDDSPRSTLSQMEVIGARERVRIENDVLLDLLDERAVERAVFLKSDKRRKQDHIFLEPDVDGIGMLEVLLSDIKGRRLAVVADGTVVSVFPFQGKLEFPIHLSEHDARSIVNRINSQTDELADVRGIASVVAGVVLLASGALLIIAAKAVPDFLLTKAVSSILSMVGGLYVFGVIGLGVALASASYLGAPLRVPYSTTILTGSAVWALIGVGLIWWGIVLWRRSVIWIGLLWIVLSGRSLLTGAFYPGYFTARYDVGSAAHERGDYVAALVDLKPLAEGGNADAQYLIGSMYVCGHGVPQNDAAAIEWYRQAAKHGHARAQYELGTLYAEGAHVAKDPRKASGWWLKASQQGFVDAQFQLGLSYARAWGVGLNYDEALKWFRKAAEQGHLDAQHSLAYMYFEGHKGTAPKYRTIPPDYQEAANWWRKAAERGSVFAQHNLGLLYAEGKGVAQDRSEAVKWLREAERHGVVSDRYVGLPFPTGATRLPENQDQEGQVRRQAESGDVRAQFALGAAYAEGKVVCRDYEQAIKWLTNAAKRGFAAAQTYLAYMYANGRGVLVDYGQAEKWLRKAAKGGDAEAQYQLGDKYAKGVGIAPNYQQALAWFGKAAEQGYSPAQYQLGLMYAGEESVQDYVRAYAWFTLAAARGENMAGMERDKVAKLMTAAQITEAQRLTEKLASQVSATTNIDQQTTEYASTQGGGGSHASPPPKPLRPADQLFELGKLDGSTYTNEYFGISLTAPKGWTILDLGDIKPSVGDAKDLFRDEDARIKRQLEETVERTTLLFSASKLPLGTTGSFNATLFCGAERIPTAVVKTPRDFYTMLLHSMKLSKALDAEVVEPLKTNRIGTTDFGTYTLKVTGNLGIAMQKHVISIKSPYAFGIIFMYADESDAKAFDEVVSSIKTQ